MFFQQLQDHIKGKGVTFNVSVTEKDGLLISSVKITPIRKLDEDEDEVEQVELSPITVTGTAEEMDAEFFNTLRGPIEKASGIYANMDEFEASAEEIKEDSKSSGSKKKSSSSSKSTASKKPSEPSVQKSEVDALVEQQDYDGAIALCDKAIKQGLPKDYWGEQKKKIENLKKGNPDAKPTQTKSTAKAAATAGKAAADKAPVLDPDQKAVTAFLADKQYFKALDLCNAMINKDPKNQWWIDKLAEVRLAKACNEMEDTEDNVIIPPPAKKPGKIPPNPAANVPATAVPEKQTEEITDVATDEDPPWENDTPLAERMEEERDELPGETVEPIDEEF